MKIDSNEFFRQATLRICGNLKIDKALHESLMFLKEIMPADRIFLQVYDHQASAMNIVALATAERNEHSGLSVPLSVDARQEMLSFQDKLQTLPNNHVWLFTDDPHRQKLTNEIFTSMRARCTSLIVMPLGLREKMAGGSSLVLATEGGRKFTQSHADMLSLLKDPFAIAMSNALKHRSELKLHDMEFFREATMRICGNLEIDEGLRATIEFLSEHMPADRLYLERPEMKLNSMRAIARASVNKGEILDALIPFSRQAREAMVEFSDIKRLENMSEGRIPPVHIVNDPMEEPVTRHLLKALGEPVSSVLGLPLMIEDQFIGGLVLLAKGNNRFTKQHARLFATLKVPFFIAMSNMIKHMEITKLQDLLADDNRFLHGELRRISGDEIIGANFGLKNVMQKIQQVATLDSPVLLLGETGVGKDVIANTIHYSSNRSKGPFVSVNCGAIPDTMIDAELFGHEKGAFTGAINQKRGRFERADNGTIFLDEIGELPPQAQVRLLRVLQSSEIERVGGDKTISLNIRIIAATNRNLEEMLRQGKFREDLWFRLNVFPVWIPPLRERSADIPALVQHFVNIKCRQLNMKAILEPALGSMDTLMQYHWPGNVRELENIVERAIILNPSGPLVFDEFIAPVSVSASGVSDNIKELQSLDAVIASHIKTVLSKTNGKVHGAGGAAEILGINPSTLRNRMNRLGIRYGRSTR